MNKYDAIIKKSKQARLNALGLQVESLLRQAGDLCEELGLEDRGYLYISNLDEGQLTAYMVGYSGHLRAAIAELGRQNHHRYQLTHGRVS